MKPIPKPLTPGPSPRKRGEERTFWDTLSAAGPVDERFLRLMALEIDRARRLYREGAELFDWLKPEGRRVFGVMTAVYHGLLEEIARRPGEVLVRRVRLSRARRLGIAARWLLLPPRRSALP